MEQATEKQVILLVKLGLEKEQAEKLSKYEASIKIKELMINKRGGVKTTSSSSQKTTKTTTKQQKETKAKVIDVDYDIEEPTQEEKPSKAKTTNYETSNQVIDMLLQQMRTDKDFLSKTKVGENKFDELAIFLYNYAKKNNKQGAFCLDTNSESYQKLEKEFLEKGFDKIMSDLCDKPQENNKNVIEKSTQKSKTTKKTTEKVKSDSDNIIGTKVKITKNKKVDSDDDYEQLCFELGI